jgi:hypothetical protein
VAYFLKSDTVLYSGAVSNTVFSKNKVFVVGNYNFNPSQFPWQNSPTWLLITRMDTNLKIIDHHFYGGDAAYMPWKILSTEDGGAIIFGDRYDYHKPWEKKHQAFALRVNMDGVITDLPDDASWKMSEAIVYPNPGRDYLILQSGPQIAGAEFTLYDMRGKPVLREKINTTQLRLNTSNLPAGIYPWQIIFKHKVIESGKWVKE